MMQASLMLTYPDQTQSCHSLSLATWQPKQIETLQTALSETGLVSEGLM